MSYEFKNTLTISHDDPKVINRIVKAYERKRLFDEFIPCPKELLDASLVWEKRKAQRFTRKYGAASWSTWRFLNWGPNQDTGCCDWNTLKKISATVIKMNIVTAYEPPVHVLDHWVDLGCDVRGSFLGEDAERRVVYKNKRVWRRGEEVDRIKNSKKVPKRLNPNILADLPAYWIFRTDRSMAAN
jgi:hypothetical protein